jgi:hypothetical protein
MEENQYSDNEEFSQSKGKVERDVEIFEVSTDQTLEQMYHSWLGESANVEGVYRRDPRLARIMNEKGASFMIGELKARINTNMHFSELTDEQIIFIASKTAENVMDRLMYYFDTFDLDVKDLESVCDQLLDALEVILTNAKEGGMKQYKVARSKVIINKQQVDTGQTAY